jgi:flagellar basal-body rod protein FlgG
MLRALYNAATGMKAQQLRIDVASNNLANVNTTGFKRSRAEFEDLLYQTLRAPGTESSQGAVIPTGLQVGQGVRTVGTARDLANGEAITTNVPTDLMIRGSGYFPVTQADGTLAFTRDGSFRLNAEGRLVNVDGLPLEPSIVIPDDSLDVTIGDDGTVTAVRAGKSEGEVVGQIQLARFANGGGLRAIGGNLFLPTAASGEPQLGTPGENGTGRVTQGHLEGSNVSVVNEMVDLITSQRAYEMSSKVVQAADEMLQASVRLR